MTYSVCTEAGEFSMGCYGFGDGRSVGFGGFADGNDYASASLWTVV